MRLLVVEDRGLLKSFEKKVLTRLKRHRLQQPWLVLSPMLLMQYCVIIFYLMVKVLMFLNPSKVRVLPLF